MQGKETLNTLTNNLLLIQFYFKRKPKNCNVCSSTSFEIGLEMKNFIPTS